MTSKIFFSLCSLLKISPFPLLTPALQTSKSMGFFNSLAAFKILFEFVTSILIVFKSGYSYESFFNSMELSKSRQHASTLNFFVSANFVKAKPIPLLAPVIRIVLIIKSP